MSSGNSIYRITHYDNLVEYQISNNCFVLTFDFGTKPSYHDIGIVCGLGEEEFHLRKSYMKTKGWSENFAVKVKREEVH